MLVAISLGFVLRAAVGIVATVLVWKAGMAILRALSAPPMPTPSPGEMRKVNVRYRCDVCGVELKMTLAPDEDPPAPNHCLEEMVFVAPVFE